jgi:hypothetical protein
MLQADGVALRIWKLGFEYFKNGKALVPTSIFSAALHAKEFLECGLAEESEEGVYIRGSRDEFRWYEERIAQAKEAGKISAQRPRDALGRLLPKTHQTPTNIQRALDNSPTLANEIQASSPSPSNSLPLLHKVKETKGELTLGPWVQMNTADFIAAYVKAFQSRYGPKARPDLRGKVQGQIKTLLKDYPVDRAIQLIQGYCQMDGQRGWFKTKGHDFGTFLENLNPVSIALEQGKEGNADNFDWDAFWQKQESGNTA